MSTNNIKYRTPIYIHSHATSLHNALSEDTVFHSTSVLKKDFLEVLYSTLEVLEPYYNNEVLRHFYYDTHEGNSPVRKMSTEGMHLLNQMRSIRETLNKEKDNQNSDGFYNFLNKLFNKLISRPDDNLETALLEELVPELGTEMTNRIVHDIMSSNKRFNSNTKVSSIITKKKQTIIKKYKRIIAIVVSEMYSSHVEVKKEMKKLQDAATDYKNANQDIAHFDMSSKADQQLIDRVDRSTAAGGAVEAITSSGFVLERVLPLFWLDSLQTSGNNIIIEMDGEQIEVPLKAESASSSLHSTTSDIYFVIGEAEKNIRVGITAKFNWDNKENDFGKTFHKASLPLTEEDFFELFECTYSDINALLYFLGNWKALTLFAAPSKYKNVFQNEDDETPDLPSTNQANVLDLSWLETIRKYAANLGLIKAFLGSLFLKGDVQAINDIIANNDKLSLPVWISFAQNDYWTYDIISRLIQEGTSDFNNFSKFIQIDQKNWEKSSLFENFNEENLQNLFIVKKLIERTSDDRLNDLLHNKVDLDLVNPTKYTKVDDILKIITSSLTFSKLREDLVSGVNYNIAVHNLLYEI